MSNSIFEKYTDKETFSKIVDYENVAEMWEASVKNYPDNVAIVDGRAYTYRELDREVSAFRTVLKNSGVTPGSLIGILSPNSIGFVKAFLAAATYGAPSVLMPAHLDAMTVFGISMKFGMKAIVYDSSLEERVSVAREKNPAVALIDSSSTEEALTSAIAVPGKTL